MHRFVLNLYPDLAYHKFGPCFCIGGTEGVTEGGALTGDSGGDPSSDEEGPNVEALAAGSGGGKLIADEGRVSGRATLPQPLQHAVQIEGSPSLADYLQAMLNCEQACKCAGSSLLYVRVYPTCCYCWFLQNIVVL